MTCQKLSNKSYYGSIKAFEYLLNSNNYHDQVIDFIIDHFEKHLDEELLEELKEALTIKAKISL